MVEKLKPLEWEQDEYGCFHAETEIGEYIAWPNGRAQFGPFRTTHVNGGEKGAMAAGEADYERRIRSTLSDAVAEREAEPVWATGAKALVRETHASLYGEYTPITVGCSTATPPTSELEALRKRVAELEKALEPFAATADETDERDADSNHIWEHHTAMNISIGDLRAARRVREGGK